MAWTNVGGKLVEFCMNCGEEGIKPHRDADGNYTCKERPQAKDDRIRNLEERLKVAELHRDVAKKLLRDILKDKDLCQISFEMYEKIERFLEER